MSRLTVRKTSGNAEHGFPACGDRKAINPAEKTEMAAGSLRGHPDIVKAPRA